MVEPVHEIAGIRRRTKLPASAGQYAPPSGFSRRRNQPPNRVGPVGSLLPRGSSDGSFRR